MFDFLLDLTTESFGDSFALGPRRHDEPSPEERKAAAEMLVGHLADRVRDLQGSAKVILGSRLYTNTRTLLLTYRHGPTICAIQTRPINSYYEQNGDPIPAPDNPTGPTATGLELTVELGTSYDNPHNGRTYHVTLKFEVWGERERVGFRQLYHDYRRPVEVLLRSVPFEFFSHTEVYRGSSLRMLDLYMQENEEDSSFSLSIRFAHDADPEQVIRSYAVFTALYEACFRYCVTTGKRPDRLIQHFSRLNPIRQ
jgi:hypothetical protein